MASITRFYALILSTVLLLSGVPGFFPDIPSFHVLVSFFELTLVHSVVHVAVGLLGLMITALASDQSVRIYTIGIALLYGALMAVGLVGVNFAPLLVFNSADNWLHGSIFVLSLGVFLAGVAEDRLGQRKAYLAEGLPQAQWAAPSRAQSVWQADMDAAPAARGPWYNNQPQQPQQPQYDQPPSAPWGAGSWQQWQQYEQPPSQPRYQQPPNQPFSHSHSQSITDSFTRPMEPRGTPRALSPAIGPCRLTIAGSAGEPLVTESLTACSASAEPAPAAGSAAAAARPVAVEPLATGLTAAGWAAAVTVA